MLYKLYAFPFIIENIITFEKIWRLEIVVANIGSVIILERTEKCVGIERERLTF